MKIDCISDLHGHYPTLEGGDLLIVAGDLTKRDSPDEFDAFFSWLSAQDYKKSIVIAGNHDNLLQNGCVPFLELDKPGDISIDYLCDSGAEFEGLKIWGSPWTPLFEGVNPQCTAFMLPEEELEAKFALIPDDTDILVTHAPPFGIFDWNAKGENCGSLSLIMKATSLVNLKLFVFGHIHERYGMEDMKKSYDELSSFFPNPECKSFPIIANCSHVNERYQPVNMPISIIL